MMNKFSEFETISKALQSTYHLLNENDTNTQLALQKLKEAEEHLNKAIEYNLLQKWVFDPD